MVKYILDPDPNVAIPGFCPSEEIAYMLWKAVEHADHQYGLNSGQTALYWHLVGVLHSHTKGYENDSSDDRNDSEGRGGGPVSY